MQKQNNRKMTRAEIAAALFGAAVVVGVFLAFQLNLIGVVNAFTSQNNVIANANVLTICFITLTPGGYNGIANVASYQTNDLVFGFSVLGGAGNGISPTFNFPTNVLLIDNDIGGNAAANILLAGSNWIEVANSANTFYVTNTLWNPSPLSTYAGNALTLYNSLGLASLAQTDIQIPAPVPVGVNSGNTANVYFGVAVPLNVYFGIYVQNIVVENAC